MFVGFAIKNTAITIIHVQIGLLCLANRSTAYTIKFELFLIIYACAHYGKE
jgi:hypothetical protein